MRTRRAATALVVLSAGLTATAVVRRLVARRRPAPLAATAASARQAPAAAPQPVPGSDAVVLPFSRRTPAGPTAEAPAVPARCGDTGGRTKAGAPCGARATSGGRCHHHRLAA